MRLAPIGWTVAFISAAMCAGAAAKARGGFALARQRQLQAGEQAAEILGSFMAVGVQGFTFNNPNLSTPELIAAAGEVKKLLGS